MDPTTIRQAAELAQTDPEAAYDALDKTAAKLDRGMVGGNPPALEKALLDVDRELLSLTKNLTKAQRLFKKHPVMPEADDWGRGEAAEEFVRDLLKVIKREVKNTPILLNIYAGGPPMQRKMASEGESESLDTIKQAAELAKSDPNGAYDLLEG